MNKNNIYWLTGLPCSGKTTIANELNKKIGCAVLDGDELRYIFKNKDFTEEGRTNHMMMVASLANVISKYVPVAVALISPIRQTRNMIKQACPNVLEIYVNCSLDECKHRDVKGMYAMAEAGEIQNFTGIDNEYEIPNITDKRTLNIKTDVMSIDECVDEILLFGGEKR